MISDFFVHLNHLDLKMHMAKEQKQRRIYLLNTSLDSDNCQAFIDGTCDKSQQFVFSDINGSNESDYHDQTVVIFKPENINNANSIRGCSFMNPRMELALFIFSGLKMTTVWS